MYCRLFQFDVRAERCDDFQRTAQEYIEGLLREEFGTIEIHFVRDDAYNFRYYLFERYADPGNHDAHARGTLMHHHGEHLAPMLLAPPLPLARGFELTTSGRPAELSSAP